MKLTLHIGPHKTGTTAIQTAFADNAAALRRKGVLYPKCNWAYPAQHRLAFAMKRKINPVDGSKPDFSTELDALCQALEKSRLPSAFISSEEFFAAPIERIAALQAALPVTSTTIIAYPRSPDAFLISCHNQKIKQVGNGYAAPITRFLKEPRKIAPEIDYLGCITAWAEVFGDANILIRPFEEGSPFDHIAGLLGVSDITQNKPVNKSVPGAVAEVMRLAKVQDMPVAQQRKLFSRATEVFADWPQFSVSPEDRLAIIKTFEADNDALFARFGMANPYRVTTFEPASKERMQNINVHDMMTLVAALI